MLLKCAKIRGTVVTKVPLRVQFLPALGERGWEGGKAEASSPALLSKKVVGREGSIESQQKFDFFCSDIMPNSAGKRFSDFLNVYYELGNFFPPDPFFLEK